MATIFFFVFRVLEMENQTNYTFALVKAGDSYKFHASRISGGDKYGIDGKTYLFYIRLSASQQKNLCALNHHFLKKKELTDANFVAPVLQGLICAI